MSVRTHEVKGRFYTAAIVRYAPRSAKPPHAHELADVAVVLAGSLVEDAGVVRVEADAGSTVLTPRQKVHADRFGASGAALLSITLEHDQELVADAALDEWRWGRTLDVYREALRLACMLCDGATATRGDATLDDLVIDLIAAADAAMNTPSARGSPPWLRNIKSLLDTHSAAAPSVGELARSAGVHPVYLARRFRQTYGCSVAHYRRRARMLAAVPALTSGQDTVSRIAAERGFADHSHLGRECKTALGVSPSSIRALLSR
jgi:AraC family transcriptional regulator